MSKNLYAQQSKLPRLPVPALEETLEKYLESAKPFLSTDEFKNSKQLLDSFKDGQGKLLQQRLLKRASEKESWLIDWWNSQGYLEPRDPVTPYSNYYFYHRQLIGNNQPRVAASLIKATLAFKQLVDTEELEPENIKGTPLCTHTYQYLFNSTRVPLRDSDKVVKFDQSNKHVIVISNNRFFKLDASNPNNLESQLQHIIDISSDKKGDAIGSLTTENRDIWSDARHHIQSISKTNSESLKAIDSASIIVALDESAPISRDQASWGAWVGDGRNRWFDKHQIIVYKNGKSAFNAEHSAMDGMITLRLNEFIMGALASKKISLGESTPVKQLEVEELKFELDNKAREYIANAEKHHDAIMGAHTMDVIQYDGYGSNLIKSKKISPDAWVQMVKQLAFWKLRGRAPGVYESCQTRKFLYGRTEVIRPTSNESTEFVRLMRDSNASDDARINALHAAAKRHLTYAGWAANGVAVDRHIYGLKNCLKEGEELHPALKDAALARSNKWELSTSQLSSPFFDGWGYSEVAADGFGIEQLENALKNVGEIVPPPTEPIISSAAYAFNSPPPLQEQSFQEEDFAESFGSLTLGISGQARYVGPSAGSEWLQNEDAISDEDLESERRNESSPNFQDSPNTPPSDFPFPGATNQSVVEEIWRQLPPIETARHLSNKYWDYDSCLYYVVPREIFDEDFEIIYQGLIDDTENEDYSGFRDADAILVPVGDLDEDSTFKKSTSLQNWLLGYEFPTTITIFLPDNTVIFIASNTKIKILKQLENANDINVELVTKSKDQEANQQALEAVVNRLAGKRIGVFSKDNAQGKSIDDWNKASQGKLGEEVDITSAIATVTAPKDTYEQKNHKYASQLSSHLLKWGMDKIMSYIDSEKKINHYTVAEQIERKAAKNEDETDAKDLSFWKKMKTFNELEYASSEPVYTPIIQSGGEYSLKPSVMSDENNLKAGVITTSLDEAAVCLTEGNKSSRDVMLFMENEDEEDSDIAEVKPKKQSSPKKKSHSNDLESAVIGNRMLRGKTRNAGREPDQSTAHKIKEHQKILHEAKNEEGLKRFAEGKDSSNGSKPEVFKRFDSYKREQQVPINRDLRILVDTKAQTVILPINGFIVPVHVSTIKNISQSVGKKEDVPFEDPDSMFIRSATFRSTDKLRFSDLYKDITELKKLSTKRAAEKREMADVVEQENLTEIKGRRPVRLGEVFARPIEGKRLAGDLDIHTNGVRYTTPTRDQKIDVLFSNVKHFFFQPCEHELIVLIHFHLKAPIMIGKKKTRDVQFYREATDASFDETGNRKRKIRYGDEDEIELEQEERRRRNALNKEFKGFAEKIAEASQDNFDVDIPYRELGFQGVPHRTGVLLQPTTECLVQLTDPPFTIITLAEVELAHLERVSFGLKTFDIVFVFSDFSKPVMHINSIQASQLDNVKEWLDSSDIPISEGPASLNWSAVMKTVNEDPKDFFESGGWSFLGGSGDQEDGSDESEPESQYNMSEDAVDDESEDSDEFDDSNDGSESDASDASDVSGESWDALERRAEKSDRKHYKGLDDEEGASKSSKGKRR
ncbi:FACT complex subunit SPT16 [Wallemia mellicola]|uniref:FACT complex subunit n=1 Tax=Wallemia mellicola TaxID=1708541 RepID=A0A4T0NX66_9BASI|nr:FACT complex subunit SPT16 [Wallemia mellicola]